MKKLNESQNISIIGDGGWGTALAVYLTHKKVNIKLWGAFPDYTKQMQQTRINRKFLPGVEIPTSIEITSDLDEAVNTADILVLAVPSQFLRASLKNLKKYDLKNKMVLSVVKGIEDKTLLRMSQVINQVLGKNLSLAVLSGPTIAMELAKGIPTTAVITSSHAKTARTLQEIFNSDTFKIYTNTDMIGVEVGGSLKNVIAIACGICDGLGYGSNTKAAILTRGLAEMSRLGLAMGAKAKTFSGLTGLGDLVTTCISTQSRNRFVGEQLGKGHSIKHILESMHAVAEGVETVKAAHLLSRKYKIPMPIATEIYNIIYKNKPATQAVTDLMARKTTAE